MSLLLTSSTPADGSVDIQTNKNIELVFNKSILESCLVNQVVSLLDKSSGKIIPATLSLATNNPNKIIVSPAVYLSEQTLYEIQIIGEELSFGYYLQASDGGYLTDTLYVRFTTGSGTYRIDTTLNKQVNELTSEGDLFLPSNVKALGYDFTLSNIRPKDHSINLPVTLTGDNTISFNFNRPLYTGETDYTDWITVEVAPILDYTGYYASGQTFGPVEVPSNSISVNGSSLVVTFGGELPKNSAVYIELSNNITSADGHTYPGTRYVAHTELYPDMRAVETIKREVRFAAESFYPDFINALLFKNAVWLWEKTGRSLSIANLPFAARQYIIYSTCLDLIYDKDLEKYILGGSRKRIADIDISYTSLVGKMAQKAIQLEALKKNALETLYKANMIRVGVLNVYNELSNSESRLWYDINGRYTSPEYRYLQQDIPTSNVVHQRRAKTTNPYYL